MPHRVFFHSYGRLVAQKANRVHVLATHGRDMIIPSLGLRPERVDVVPPAADMNVADSRVGRRPDTGAGRPFALYVGNHKPHKNLERLLRAYARVAGRMESELLVVGARSSHADPDSLPYAKLVDELSLTGQVKFAGQVDVPPERQFVGLDGSTWM